MSDRETWASRLGFILAAIGSAVGLGNIWQFPFKTATNGGAVFLVFYLAAVLLIGFPAMLAEFIIGRRTNHNAVDAFTELGHRQWRVVGALGVVTGFWILSYYNVVGGWVMRYILGSATGAYFGSPAEYFGAISTGPEAVAGQALFLLVCLGIVALGIEDGIEKATKLMVPSIVVLMLAMAAWVTTLEGAGAGYSYFLSPDFSTLAANAGDLIPFAVGQAFFTLSLGMAAMITYSSYIADDESLPTDGGIIVVTNTLIGVLAGLVVFPILFAIGVSPDTSGPSAIFVAMASAFPQLPAGRLLGVVFFGVVLIAAVSSAISLLEVVVSYGVDNTSYSRVSLSAAVGVALFVLGLPSAWNLAWFGWFDTLAYKLFLPLSVLLILVFVGWVLSSEAVEELRQGTGGLRTFGPVWLWMVRTVVLLGVVLTLALGLETLFLAEDPAIVPPV
ncbi:sodium-dependent transporter [Haloarcula sp. 1CSR25-25]|uniref:sodium-dependent transporter n=1 Tax=Haloarcula sp. 1CSR25-25 TaxID=2862545 RepID=UPI002894E9B1|nr:sodium-dependent transporter [Haloarcula sp. 1CSR25-25]MDT3434551.1 sodium-dependent transporter [Haloarcula sp. 1CSR25-25]